MGRKKTDKEKLAQRIEVEERLLDGLKDSAKVAQKILEIEQLQLENLEKYGGSLEDVLDQKVKMQGLAEKAAVLEKTSADAKQAALAATEGVDGATKELLKKTVILSDTWRQGIVGAIADSKQPVKDLTTAIKKNIKASNVLGSVFSSMVQMTIQIAKNANEASVSISALTGSGRSYASTVAGISRANAAFGVTIADAGKAFGGLYQGFTDFSNLSGKQQNALAGHAARLERFGIAAGTTAQNFQDMTGAYGLSNKEARESQEDLVNLSRAIGMPPQQMMEGMQESSGVLSKWGKDAPRIFGKVAIHAKKLGVSFDTLLNLGDQFDTFEGAASAVGKLNALVGGDVLNAYDMMNMSLEERNMAVKRAVELDGESWGSMNRMKKMAYANAAGISDMADAERIFGGASADSLSESEKKAKAQAKHQKHMNTALTKTVSIMDKFELLMEKIFGFDKEGTNTVEMIDKFLTSASMHIKEIRIALGVITAGAGLLQLTSLFKMAGAMNKARQAAGLAKGAGMLGKLAAGAAGLLSLKALAIGGLVVGGGVLAYKGYQAYKSRPKAQSGGAGGAVRKASGARASTGNAETDRLAAALTVAINNSQGHDVVLKIDGNEIGRFTERYLGQKYKMG